MYDTSISMGETPEKIAEVIVEATFDGKIRHSDEIVYKILVPAVFTAKQFRIGLKYMD